MSEAPVDLLHCTGTPEPKNTHAQGGSHDHEDVGPAMLQTDPASETGKQGGVLKQILYALPQFLSRATS